MKSFPMFIRTTGRRVVIVGGGEQAAQKARLILKTDADLVLAAPDLDDELSALVAEGRARHHPGRITAALFDEAAMAFVGTGCPGLNAAIAALARAARCPVNVVDQPELCDITTPALVDRDPLVIAIGSEGTAPVLTRDIKTRLEAMLPPTLGGLSALAGRLRPSVNSRVPRARRRALWAWMFKGAPREAWIRGGERDVARMLKAAIAAGGPPDDDAPGQISLVGAGPGARDLLTLRAVERLQEADVIFYDRLVDEEVLELARRDAERVFVGKHAGACAWPQDRINALIVAEAAKGRRVVRLKSGDPGIFGRAGEELDAARSAGIPVEIVPGVTAASAAGAAFGQSLTERGVSDTLVLTTGTSRAGDGPPDSVRLTGPGTTTCFYMSARQAGRLQSDLVARGLAAETVVRIGMHLSKPGQRLMSCRLDRLETHMREADCDGCAIIMVTWPKPDLAHTQTRAAEAVCA